MVAFALRSRCSAMHRAEIDLRQHVAVEHDHRLAQRLAGVAHGAGGAERRRLDDVADAQPAVAAVAEDLFDPARLVVEAEDDLVDLRHLLQQIELVVEERPVEDRHDRLRRVNRQRTEARALAPREQDRLHRQPPMLSWARLAHMNLPNSLTVTRIFLVPLLVVVLLTKFEGRMILGVPKELVGAAIFGIASLTDWLDGYLARRRKQVTPLGQFIDPLADKLLTIAAFISLVQMDLAPAWMVAVIIGREFAVTALRSLAYARGVAMPASPLGKIKMVAQVVAILALILGKDHLHGFVVIGRSRCGWWCVTALVSAADYFRRFESAPQRANSRRRLHRSAPTSSAPTAGCGVRRTSDGPRRGRSAWQLRGRRALDLGDPLLRIVEVLALLEFLDQPSRSSGSASASA